jgi:hypothetical protein
VRGVTTHILHGKNGLRLMVSAGQSMQESPEAPRCQCLPLRCGFPDEFIGLNGITVPGTLRDSLVLLSVVLEQQTELQPTEI